MAPTFAVAKGVGFLVEFRYDKSDADVYREAGGNFTDNVFSVALEFTYSFKHTFDITVKQ